MQQAVNIRKRYWLAWFVALYCCWCGAVLATLNKEEDAEGNNFFRSLDIDNDGDVDENEIRELINELGGEDLDEALEIQFGIDTAIKNLDNNKDSKVLHSELVKRWVHLSNVMSVEETAEWMRFGVRLTDETIKRFKQYELKGIDLPKLLNAKQSSKIFASISKIDKAKLLHAIKLKMAGIGDVPLPPQLQYLNDESTRCGAISLRWHAPLNLGSIPLTSSSSLDEIYNHNHNHNNNNNNNNDFVLFKPHTYRLFRRVAREDDTLNDPWGEPIYSGAATAYLDRGKNIAERYDYKLEAWSIIGVSPPVELHDLIPSSRNCDQSTLVKIATHLWDNSQSIVLVLSLLYYYYVMNVRQSDGGNQQHQHAARMLQSTNGVSARELGGSNFNHGESGDADLLYDVAISTARASGTFRAELNTSDPSKFGGRDRCTVCNKLVTRTTRHVCGGCSKVFCVTHTAFAPHADVKLGSLGTRVITSCGVNPKCRCLDCYRLEHGNAVPLKKTSSRSGGAMGEEEEEGSSSSSAAAAAAPPPHKRSRSGKLMGMLKSKKTV